jgi:hypothetical protein
MIPHREARFVADLYMNADRHVYSISRTATREIDIVTLPADMDPHFARRKHWMLMASRNRPND